MRSTHKEVVVEAYRRHHPLVHVNAYVYDELSFRATRPSERIISYGVKREATRWCYGC